MKKKFRISAIFMMVALLITIMPLSASDGIISDSDIVVPQYTKQQQQIFDKVEELGRLRARMAEMCIRYNVSPENDDFGADTEIGRKIEEIRSELIELGAKPTDEILSSLSFETPVSVNGVLIDDFADFEYTFGDAFDLWGVSQTVNASYGTYETYTIMIQDPTAKQSMFGSYITQGGTPGYELLSESSPAFQVMIGSVIGVVFNHVVTTISEHIPVISKLENTFQFFSDLKSDVDAEINGNYAITAEGGLTQSYRVTMNAAPTVIFIFVKDANSNTWQHTFTTNNVSIYGYRDWELTWYIDGEWVSTSKELPYEYTVLPNRYAYRLTHAVTAYRNDKALYYDLVEDYDFYVERGSTSVRAFSLGIVCPMDQFDLIRYGLQ